MKNYGSWDAGKDQPLSSFTWPGRTHLDGGHTWIYVGSYYSYEQLVIDTGDER